MRAQTPDYLFRRGNWFYFRRGIPLQLRRRFKRREIKVSLGTEHPGTARRLCRVVANRFDRLIALAKVMPELTPQVIERLLKDYFAKGLGDFRDTLELATTDPSSGFEPEAELEFIVSELPQLKQRLVKRDYDSLTQVEAKKSTEAAGYDVPGKNSDNWDVLCHGILRARTEQFRIFAAMLNGNYDDVEPKDPLFKAPAAAVMGQIGGSITGHSETIKELANKYLKLKESVWVKKTQLDNKRVLGWFMELVDADKPITSVTKAHVGMYRDLLMNLPKNYTKAKKFEGLSVTEAVKAGEDAPKISLRTASKYLSMFKGFQNWCVEEEHLLTAPGSHIKVPYKGNPVEARLPFSPSQLKTIFSSPVYAGCKSAGRRSMPGEFVIRDGRFWIPLIALFSGMRLGEIVQMYVSDVREEGEVWILDVTTMDQDEAELSEEEIEKNLKTSQSQRRIPIHEELKRIGFLNYVAECKQKKAPSKRLFPDINPGKDGYFSHNFSKTFSRYLKAIEVKTPKHVFHSFRHNFTDVLHIAGIDDSHQDALMGHLDMKKAKTVYGTKGMPLKALINDMQKLDFAIDLDHLYVD